MSRSIITLPYLWVANFPHCSVEFELFALYFTDFDFVETNAGDIYLLTQTYICKLFLDMHPK